MHAAANELSFSSCRRGIGRAHYAQIYVCVCVVLWGQFVFPSVTEHRAKCFLGRVKLCKWMCVSVSQRWEVGMSVSVWLRQNFARKTTSNLPPSLKHIV